MKQITILFFAVISIMACSNNNCSEEKQSINDYYEKQIQLVKDDGKDSPLGVNYRQIGLLEKERDKKLAEACN